MLGEYAYFRDEGPTLESQVASLADVIAYRSHDIEDALNSGILTKDDFREAGLDLWDELEAHVADLPEDIRTAQITRTLIDLFISDALTEMQQRLSNTGTSTAADVRAVREPLVRFSAEFERKQSRLGEFLREAFYKHYKIMRMTDKGQRVIRALIGAYQDNPRLLPPDVQVRYEEAEDRNAVLADVIAGMTDRYAVMEYTRLFNPEVRV